MRAAPDGEGRGDRLRAVSGRSDGRRPVVVRRRRRRDAGGDCCIGRDRGWYQVSIGGRWRVNGGEPGGSESRSALQADLALGDEQTVEPEAGWGGDPAPMNVGAQPPYRMVYS